MILADVLGGKTKEIWTKSVCCSYRFWGVVFVYQIGARLGAVLQDYCAVVLKCYGQCIMPELGSKHLWIILTFRFDHLGPSFDQILLHTTLFDFHPLCVFRMGPFYASFEGAKCMPLEWAIKICHSIRTSRYVWKVLRMCHHGTSFERENNYVL